jgi:D-arabinose 1-dehydrogenase-like Zn-dependent alcohol dehydrogenase
MRFLPEHREMFCTHLKGQIGFSFDGGYAEYVKVPASSLFPIPAGIPFEQAAIMTDAIATPYRALTAKTWSLTSKPSVPRPSTTLLA